MNPMHDSARMRPIDCPSLKAMLSAYLDDELTRDERLHADAHLVGCVACRNLVERAEQLDASLRIKIADDVADAARGLAATPIDVARLQAQVLAAIGHERRRTWRPRLAAAAAIAAVIGGGWWFWNTRETPQSLAPTGPGTFVRGGDALLPAFAMLPVDPPADPTVRMAALSDEDRQTLYATSLILDSTRRTAFVDEARRRELRDVVRYDELVDRLGEVMSRLPPEKQAAVALARDATARIAAAAEDPREWIALQQDVERRALAPTIEMMSDTP